MAARTFFEFVNALGQKPVADLLGLDHVLVHRAYHVKTGVIERLVERCIEVWGTGFDADRTCTEWVRRRLAARRRAARKPARARTISSRGAARARA